MNVQGFDEFELDLELAFKRDLPPFIDGLEAAPLTFINVSSIPAKKNGVYLLLQDDKVMYVGKTDSRGGFQNRLLRHSEHVKHRHNLDPNLMHFKAVAIPVFKNADLETILIDHYGAPWNNSGFGGNDPGKERDTQRPAVFDLNHPIDIDRDLDFIQLGLISAQELLRLLSARLPYTFRYEKRKYQDELNFNVEITAATSSMRELLMLILNGLPSSVWQTTILYGRIILYRENREYPFFQEVIRS
ncbi:Eco29kI family restriction endonuclease [Paenibacillus sp. 1011MAR3C5]|uniref:Eco29kI family restriction endonuclease n=1 Tax=Paenibacillus sp. 1011MAR3C5 TaxID=1675787 RepID=UPI002175B8E2|nr:Eco29kI family restriction endonuclease [Paenibacillus sp. 1011MAR3C5]